MPGVGGPQKYYHKHSTLTKGFCRGWEYLPWEWYNVCDCASYKLYQCDWDLPIKDVCYFLPEPKRVRIAYFWEHPVGAHSKKKIDTGTVSSLIRLQHFVIEPSSLENYQPCYCSTDMESSLISFFCTRIWPNTSLII